MIALFLPILFATITKLLNSIKSTNRKTEKFRFIDTLRIDAALSQWNLVNPPTHTEALFFKYDPSRKTEQEEATWLSDYTVSAKNFDLALKTFIS